MPTNDAPRRGRPRVHPGGRPASALGLSAARLASVMRDALAASGADTFTRAHLPESLRAYPAAMVRRGLATATRGPGPSDPTAYAPTAAGLAAVAALPRDDRPRLYTVRPRAGAPPGLAALAGRTFAFRFVGGAYVPHGADYPEGAPREVDGADLRPAG